MLRISTSDSMQDEVIVHLEGEIARPWTDELEGVVATLISEEKRVVLEMSAVRFIEAHAVDILHKWTQSVVLSNCSPFVRELLKARSSQRE